VPNFTIPIHEANDCHLPAGRPDGGHRRSSKQFPQYSNKLVTRQHSSSSTDIPLEKFARWLGRLDCERRDDGV
jgi:hypothetical protein